MISIHLSTVIKCIGVILLQFFSSCQDGLTYDEKGMVVTEQPYADTSTQSYVTDTIIQNAINQLPVSVPVDPVIRDNSRVADNLNYADTAKINTRSVTPDELVSYAEKQLGVRYRYASIDPETGFDCSGFITYVFNHFKIKVPRASVDFTHVGRQVPIDEARKGDIILFTGTNSSIRVVGHMGIVHSTDSSQIKFIHSSSGKANGVTITPLNGYYLGRFMSIRRIFRERKS